MFALPLVTLKLGFGFTVKEPYGTPLFSSASPVTTNDPPVLKISPGIPTELAFTTRSLIRNLSILETPERVIKIVSCVEESDWILVDTISAPPKLATEPTETNSKFVGAVNTKVALVGEAKSPGTDSATSIGPNVCVDPTHKVTGAEAVTVV